MRLNYKKILARVGIGLLALGALGLLVRAGFNYSNGRRLERGLRELRDRGVPLSMGEIEPECRMKDNAARPWKAAEALFSIEKGQRELIRDAMAAVTGMRPLEDEDRDQLEEIIAAQGEFLDLIRSASAKSCFKFEEDWSMPPGEWKVPNMVAMVQGMRLLGIDAVLKAETGRVAEALEQCRAGMRLMELRLSSPSLIDYLVSIACVKGLAACQRMILSGADPNEETLEKIVKRFQPEPWWAGLSRALDGERIYGFEEAMSILQSQNIEELGLSGNDRLYFWLFKPVIKAETLWVLRIFDRMQKLTGRPFHEILNEKGEFIEPFPEPPRIYRMADLLLPNMEATFLKRASLVAIFDTIRLGVACRIYRNRHGEWPESLDRLVPGILKQLPLDPFTGDPYVYRRKDTGFIVYSLGSNRRDDEGRETWMITQLVMPKDDDWSWRESDLR